MGCVTEGAVLEDGLPQSSTNSAPSAAEQFAQRENGSGFGGGGGSGNTGGGGGSGDGGGDDWRGRRDWAMARETAYLPSGEVIRVSLGYNGYTTVVENHETLGYGKTTGHKDGALHRHGFMSNDQEKGHDKIPSDVPFKGNLGDIIGKPNP